MQPLRLALETSATPGDVLRALRDDRMPFALTGAWAGGGAILGSEPVRVARGPEALDAVDLPAIDAPAGFVGGGWFGMFGFGLGAAIERLPPAPPRPAPLPGAVLGFYDHVVRLDRDGRWWFEALDAAAVDRRHDLIARRLRDGTAARPWRLGTMRPRGAAAAGHRAAVAECVERIGAGELFQANVCLRLDGRFEGSVADAYAEASERLAPAHGAFFGVDDDAALLSFSPELFLRREGRVVETAPIKGTAPRDPTDVAAADRARDALAASAKDAAEHVMIVDLMRNDLGRVAEYGSVTAAERPDVEAHPGLWHLVSRVRARLRDGVGDGALLRATFPPGSVTGAPKIQALKVISELEGTGREAYTGAIGFISPAAGLELNVAIRTLEVRGDRAWMGCGGGVVADSDPGAELHEALGKARPVLAALGARLEADDRRPLAGLDTVPRIPRPDPALGLLETIAVRDRRPVALHRHLDRLAASAAELYDLRLPADLGERVRSAAAVAEPGVSRLRLVLAADGAADIATTPARWPSGDVVLQPVRCAGGLGAHKWADRSPVAGLDGPGRAGLVCDLDGTVLEASSANVWALEGGRLITPKADGRILAGTTRARILGLAASLGLDAAEDDLTLDRLTAADGLLITSAVRIASAAAMPGTEPSEAARDAARRLREALAARVASAPAGPVAQLVRAADS